MFIRHSGQRFVCASILIVSSVLDAAAQVQPSDSQVVNAVSGIVASFQEHPVVAIGECHWLREAGDFYVRLVRDPGFQGSVQDVVIEFASRNTQPLLDRYIAGEDMPLEDIRRIWRDTTKVASWESPIYAQWLAAIREVNRGLPPSRRLRVLAGDTAIDWRHIQTHAQWADLGDNNVSIANVILGQVLHRKRHALVVLGTNHVVRDEGGNTTARVEAEYPGSTYVALMLCPGTVALAAQELLRSTNPPTPALMRLGGAFYAKPKNHNESSLDKKADALLYLGPPQSLTMQFPPPASLEPEYMKEVDRRSMIEWGELRARKFLGAAAR